MLKLVTSQEITGYLWINQQMGWARTISNASLRDILTFESNMCMTISVSPFEFLSSRSHPPKFLDELWVVYTKWRFKSWKHLHLYISFLDDHIVRIMTRIYLDDRRNFGDQRMDVHKKLCTILVVILGIVD